MEDQDAFSWRGKRGSYSSPRNHICCPSSLQDCSTKRINLREARTYQGEHHGCPQVGQVQTKNFRAAKRAVQEEKEVLLAAEGTGKSPLSMRMPMDDCRRS